MKDMHLIEAFVFMGIGFGLMAAAGVLYRRSQATLKPEEKSRLLKSFAVEHKYAWVISVIGVIVFSDSLRALLAFIGVQMTLMLVVSVVKHRRLRLPGSYYRSIVAPVLLSASSMALFLRALVLFFP